MQVWVALHRAHAAALLDLTRTMEAVGDVSVIEHGCLYELTSAPNRRLRMTELAERLGLSPSAATRVIDRLEVRGWVEREIPGNNRRTVLVRPTVDGRRAFVRNNRRFSAAVQAAMGARLSEAQMTDLTRLLALVREERKA